MQEYEAITRGLIKGNPSVPVQGTTDETKQVLSCSVSVVILIDNVLQSVQTEFKCQTSLLSMFIIFF